MKASEYIYIYNENNKKTITGRGLQVILSRGRAERSGKQFTIKEIVLLERGKTTWMPANSG